MNSRTLFSLTNGVAALAVVAVLGWLVYGWLRPAEPTPDVEPVPSTPASLFLNAEASIAFYEEQIRKTPDDLDSYTRLAQVYLQHARRTGEETKYVPLAKERIDQALAKAPNDYYAQALHVSLLNTLHRFDESRPAVEKLLKTYPHDSFLQGVLIDALVELGEYEAAVAASDRLLGLRPSLTAYARASYLREIHGDGVGAIEAMTLAAQAGVPGQEDRAWALLQLGNLHLGQNRLDEAERVFKGILEEVPGYAQAIGGLGHLAQVRGDLETAAAHYEKALALENRMEFNEHLADIAAARGDEARAEWYLDTVDAAFRAASDMGENNRMEYADFLADRGMRLDEALQLAEAEIARRTGHLHALETYAWALHKNGRSAEAVAPIERAMRLNTGDAMVHFRAGHIYRSAGMAEKSAEQFRLALENHLHIESGKAAEEARAMIAG